MDAVQPDYRSTIRLFTEEGPEHTQTPVTYQLPDALKTCFDELPTIHDHFRAWKLHASLALDPAKQERVMRALNFVCDKSMGAGVIGLGLIETDRSFHDEQGEQPEPVILGALYWHLDATCPDLSQDECAGIFTADVMTQIDHPEMAEDDQGTDLYVRLSLDERLHGVSTQHGMRHVKYFACDASAELVYIPNIGGIVNVSLSREADAAVTRFYLPSELVEKGVFATWNDGRGTATVMLRAHELDDFYDTPRPFVSPKESARIDAEIEADLAGCARLENDHEDY